MQFTAQQDEIASPPPLPSKAADQLAKGCLYIHGCLGPVCLLMAGFYLISCLACWMLGMGLHFNAEVRPSLIAQLHH
jgi:hypothetical protein